MIFFALKIDFCFVDTKNRNSRKKNRFHSKVKMESVKNLCFKKLNMQAIKIPRLNNDMPYFMKKCLTIINFILRTS